MYVLRQTLAANTVKYLDESKSENITKNATFKDYFLKETDGDRRISFKF